MIAIFGDDLRLLAMRAYPKLSSDAQESLALNQFYKTISLEMKCRCIDRDCQTIEQAVETVERYEIILGDDKRHTFNVRAIYSSDNENQQETEYQTVDIAKQIKNVLERIERMESEMQRTTSSQHRNYQYRNRQTYSGCYTCGSLDHYMRNCQQNKQTMSNRSQQSGNYKQLE